MIKGLSEGDRVARLTLIEKLPREAGKNRKGRFLCDCGAETNAVISRVKSGATRSCGCLRREISVKTMTKHGKRNSGTYGTWSAMIARCCNPKNGKFKDYGGRGISVCKSWLNFAAFLTDMGERPQGMTLDRIDNSRGYSPENCRWATQSEQNKNQRKRSGCTSEFKGVSHMRTGRWQAHITINRKRVHLGYFETELEAADAHRSARNIRDLNIETENT